jgi:hypothetical protein
VFTHFSIYQVVDSNQALFETAAVLDIAVDDLVKRKEKESDDRRSAGTDKSSISRRGTVELLKDDGNILTPF